MNPAKTIYTGHKLKRALRESTYANLAGLVRLNFKVERIAVFGDKTSGLAFSVAADVPENVCRQISNFLNGEVSPL